MKKKKVIKPKVVSKRVYSLTWKIHDDGSSTLSRTNDGFNLFELLGIISEQKRDIIKQIDGLSPGPDIIEKKAIVRR